MTETETLDARTQSQSRSSWRGSDTDREEEGSGGSKERESNDGEPDEDDDMLSEHSGSSKRQRRESADSCGSSVEMWAFYVDAAEAVPSMLTTTMTSPLLPCAPPPQLELELVLELEGASCSGGGGDGQVLIQDMVTTSIAERASRARAKEESFEYEEWEGVKGTLRRASELYDGALLRRCSCVGAYRRAIYHVCNA